MQLQIKNMVAKRGGRHVFGPLSFDLQSGECVVVRGPNGVGKSTLLRILAGLLQPAAGTVTINHERNNLAAPVGTNCHYIGHQDGLKASLTVAENLNFYQRLYKIEPAEPSKSVDEALHTLNLSPIHALPVGNVSAGMRKRIALARLLLNFRPIWLLDEPSTHLDNSTQNTLAQMIAEHLDKCGLVVATTHQPFVLTPHMEIHLDMQTAPEETLL